MKRLFIFGFGYTALALAGQLRTLGWDVAGTTRRANKIRDLRALGFTVYPFSREEPLRAPLAALSDFPYVLHSTPPDDLGDPVFDLAGGSLATLAPQLRWFGYLSTTGVYGDRQGDWVDETTPLNPTTPRERKRAEAEQRWHSITGLPLHIFRLSGIYGPGRNVLDDLRTGQARRIDKPDHVFNRIHVADITQTLLASMHRPNAGAIYNLADDEPSSSRAVVEEGARLLNLAPPPLIPFAEAQLSPMGQSFYAACKRVRNDRMKRELGIRLLYPSYREGLRALISDHPS